MHDSCEICQRIDAIRNGSNPFFVKELGSGYVVFGDHQFFRGYTLFLYKHHREELHELTKRERSRYLNEMAIVAGAVYKAFNPRKLNNELLGNTERHLHWHIFPRHTSDPEPTRPVWVIGKQRREAQAAKPSSEELKHMKRQLLEKL